MGIFVSNVAKNLLLCFDEKVESLLLCCMRAYLFLIEQPGLNSITGTKVCTGGGEGDLSLSLSHCVATLTCNNVSFGKEDSLLPPRLLD